MQSRQPNLTIDTQFCNVRVLSFRNHSFEMGTRVLAKQYHVYHCTIYHVGRTAMNMQLDPIIFDCRGSIVWIICI